MKTRFVPLLALLLLVGVPASAQTERTVSFRSGPTISILVPMGYSFEGRNNTDGSVRIAMENPVWNIQIEALIAMESDPQMTKRTWQENKLVTFIAAALSYSKEDDYVFRPLPVESGSGVYCVFTAQGAAQPPPGESAPGSYFTGGLKSWPGCVVVFRIISADKSSPEYEEALQLFTHSFTRR